MRTYDDTFSGEKIYPGRVRERITPSPYDFRFAATVFYVEKGKRGRGFGGISLHADEQDSVPFAVVVAERDGELWEELLDDSGLNIPSFNNTLPQLNHPSIHPSILMGSPCKKPHN